MIFTCQNINIAHPYTKTLRHILCLHIVSYWHMNSFYRVISLCIQLHDCDEFTIPADEQYVDLRHLAFSDMSIDNSDYTLAV